MSYNLDVFVRQMPVLRDFLMHYVSYKELHAIISSVTQYNALLNKTTDAHYMQALNCFCMVFGAESSNPTHWKHLISNKEDFKEIYSRASLNKDAWDAYWKELTTFRNNITAHRHLKFNEPVPFLGTAFEMALIYDEWVRAYIYPDVLDDPLLEDMVAEYRVEVREFIEKIKGVIK